MRKPAKKPVTRLYIQTLSGLQVCNVPDFEPASYKGLKQNCGRVSKHPIKTRNKKTSHAL